MNKIKTSIAILILMTVAWSLYRLSPLLITTFNTPGYIPLLGFCLLYCVSTLLFLPATPLILATGAIFGLYWGFVFNLINAILSAGLSFLISRYIGLHWLSETKSKQINAGLARIESYGWKSLALCRLTPFLPCAPVNYAFGLTSMRFSVFIAITLPFYMPLKWLETYIGATGIHWFHTLMSAHSVV
jgi:uncharacterized membrane protein YdjX (TVP38/TMEM64 family)